VAPVATRIANHCHSLEVMRLRLQLYLHVGFGCRGVGSGLRVTAGVRAATTVLHWPLPRHDDRFFVIDHTLAPGALKCLVVPGIPASRLSETRHSPCHSDMKVLAVEVMANSTGVRVGGGAGTGERAHVHALQ
jgi:hypothetical protein